MKKHSTQSQALAHLKQLVDQGCEFPDAVWETTKVFELTALDVEILEMNYDNQHVDELRHCGMI